MTNNIDGSDYSGTDYKHDCPRPLVGCDYPQCECDVDGENVSKEEKDED